MKKITIQIILLILAFGLSFSSISVKGNQLEERCQMQCVDVAMIQTAGWPISFKEEAITYEGSENYKLEDFHKFKIDLYLLNVLIFFIFLNGFVNLGREIYQISTRKKK